MTEPFRTTCRVEFCETDMAGVAHFANYFRWMEAAEVAFLRSLGLTVVVPWQGQQLGFPRVAVSCDYLKPVCFDDVLEITVRLERLGRKSVKFLFEFFKIGELVARGQMTAVCCRTGAGEHLESVEIPEPIRAKLGGV